MTRKSNPKHRTSGDWTEDFSQGYILDVSISPFTGDTIISIATGFVTPSGNIKTGPMVQIYTIRLDKNPVHVGKEKSDACVCGDCPHARHNNGTCYVALFHGPRAVWESFHKGNYKKVTDFSVFNGYRVRFGAYGDPTLIPLDVVEKITQNCDSWTGYTHQWRNEKNAGYKRFFQASCDNPSDVKIANASGWSTFLVTPEKFNRKELEFKHTLCPSYASDGKVQCYNCLKCNGAFVRIRNIIIPAHGRGASKVTF